MDQTRKKGVFNCNFFLSSPLIYQDISYFGREKTLNIAVYSLNEHICRL